MRRMDLQCAAIFLACKINKLFLLQFCALFHSQISIRCFCSEKGHGSPGSA